jgi:hypothetical protein
MSSKVIFLVNEPLNEKISTMLWSENPKNMLLRGYCDSRTTKEILEQEGYK